MYTRTREAVRFLERCKEAVAPYLAAGEGIPVPPSATRGGASSGSAPASDADEDSLSPEHEAYARLKSSLTGGDVVECVLAMRSDLAESAITLLRLREDVARSQDESHRILEAAERAGIAVSSSGAGAGTTALNESDLLTSLRRQVVELNDRNASLASKLDEARRDAAAAAAASAALRVAGRAPPTPRDDGGYNEPPPRSSRSVAGTPHANARLAASTAFSASTAAGSDAPVSARDLRTAPAPLPSVASQSAEEVYAAEWAFNASEAARLEREGALSDAEQQYAAVLAAKLERCGAASPSVAGAHRDLGRVLALQRKFDAAEEHYSTGVQLCVSSLGEDHPNTACALTDLAAVLREQGKFEGAERYAYRAVASLKKGVGAEDTATGTALYNLAGLQKRLGKYAQALVSTDEGAGGSCTKPGVISSRPSPHPPPPTPAGGVRRSTRHFPGTTGGGASGNRGHPLPNGVLGAQAGRFRRRQQPVWAGGGRVHVRVWAQRPPCARVR